MLSGLCLNFKRKLLGWARAAATSAVALEEEHLPSAAIVLNFTHTFLIDLKLIVRYYIVISSVVPTGDHSRGVRSVKKRFAVISYLKHTA